MGKPGQQIARGKPFKDTRPDFLLIGLFFRLNHSIKK